MILETIQILVSFPAVPQRASIRLIGIQCLAAFRRWTVAMQSMVFETVGILVSLVAIFHQTAVWLFNVLCSWKLAPTMRSSVLNATLTVIMTLCALYGASVIRFLLTTLAFTGT